MARKRRRARKSPAPLAAPQETRAAEAITVFWMLSVMATVLAEIAALLTRAWVVWVAPVEPLRLLSGLLLLIATTTGTLSLVALPVVLRQRRAAPPRAVIHFALIVGILPLVALVLLSF